MSAARPVPPWAGVEFAEPAKPHRGVRVAALLATACALAFLATFGLGRALSTSGAAREVETPNLSAAAVPTPVPAQLATVQAIGTVVPIVVVQRRPKPAVRRASPFTRVQPTQIVPASQTTTSQAVSAPVTETTPRVSNSAPASSAPAPSKTSAAPKGGGGTSFDSSG